MAKEYAIHNLMSFDKTQYQHVVVKLKTTGIYNQHETDNLNKHDTSLN